MYEVLVGSEGMETKVKSRVLKLLSKSEKVCLISSEENIDYYADMRWRSEVVRLENIAFYNYKGGKKVYGIVNVPKDERITSLVCDFGSFDHLVIDRNIINLAVDVDDFITIIQRENPNMKVTLVCEKISDFIAI